MTAFTFILGSTRKGGNSEALARRAARNLDATWLHLVDHPLPPFFDTRHTTGYEPPTDNAKLVCDATLASPNLVLVTPVNWYSVSWPMKLYLDHWSAWQRIPSLAFTATLKGRAMWAVVVDSDDERAGSADPVIDALRRTADYMDMEWRGALHGVANRPGEIEQDADALAAADSFFSTSTRSSA